MVNEEEGAISHMWRRRELYVMEVRPLEIKDYGCRPFREVGGGQVGLGGSLKTRKQKMMMKKKIGERLVLNAVNFQG